MPEGSYNLPAAACQTGAKLALIEGTPCHGCYALKGRYNFSNVQQALRKRLKSLMHPLWTEAMPVHVKGKQWAGALGLWQEMMHQWLTPHAVNWSAAIGA